MATGARRLGRPFSAVVLVLLAGTLVTATETAVQAGETPRRGGVLLAAIGADAPSLDSHQAQTFGLWWSRNVVHWAKVKNWVAPPSHFTNQKLQDVWLAED
ncbi:MAG TPA: hypothetical protein VET45_20565 [Candidatus Binatia bacterium]|nr:hypothetical protein [Candidatus Binatia bacterium]